MKVYAIRHNPSGEHMPANMFKSARYGWSHWIPGDEHYGGATAIPRLFLERGTALRALNAWLAGPINKDLTSMRPSVPRYRHDMEITTGYLTL